MHDNTLSDSQNTMRRQRQIDSGLAYDEHLLLRCNDARRGSKTRSRDAAPFTAFRATDKVDRLLLIMKVLFPWHRTRSITRAQFCHEPLCAVACERQGAINHVRSRHVHVES